MSSRFARSGAFALTALGYIAAGKLALLMAIPPGYATAVWPAAGIAVVAVLHGGYRLAAAVAIGSFVINVPAGFPLTGTMVAGAIAVGAALQALTARHLVLRFVGYPAPLTRPGDVVRFLLATGPLACLVGASCGVATLLAGGLANSSTIGVSWVTWWVGDTIGVVIFVPVLLAFVGAPRAAWRRRRLVVVAPLLFGFASVVVFFVLASGWEVRRQSSELSFRAEVLSRAIERQLERYIDSGIAVAGLYRAIDTVTQDELTTFADGVRDDRPGVLSLSWIAVVPADQRASYERRNAQALPTEIGAIWQLDSKGERARADERAVYYPLEAVAPLAASRRILGFDLGSEPVRRAALERARDRAVPTATPRIDLLQDSSGLPGFLILVPVYGKPSAVGGRPVLRGFSSTAVRVHDVVSAALIGFDDAGIMLRIVDEALDTSTRVLYGRDGADDSKVQWSRRFEVAGRGWRIDAEQTAEALSSRRSWQGWTVLAGGLLFVGLLGSVLLIISGNESRLADAEAGYRDLYDHSPDMYLTVDAQSGVVLDCNQTTSTSLGRQRAAIVGHEIFAMYAPSSQDPARAALAIFREHGEVHDVELQVVRSDGVLLDVSLSVTAIRDAAGAAIRSRSVWRDITARKRLDRDLALKLSLGDELRAVEDLDTMAELVARRLGEHLGVARCFLCDVDLDRETMTLRRDYHSSGDSLVGEHKLSEYSRETQAALRAGRTVVIADTAADPRTAAVFESGYRSLGLRALIGVPLTRDGRWVASLWAIRDSPYAWEPREVVLLQSIADRAWLWIEQARMLVQLRDLNESLERRIVDRTRALETAVRDKDVLLREIHHRVKNNLQVISSLLNLQSMGSANAAVRSALSDSRDRIQSLALVHDQLYRARNAATIELDRYLRELVSSIERTQMLATVRVHVETSPCTLPLDQAVPCGLIVNELITNAVKHAFPAGRSGNIVVTATRETDESLRLTVHDDGVGLPADFALESSSGLGMTIVETLSKQIGATLAFRREGGTTFVVHLPAATSSGC